MVAAKVLALGAMFLAMSQVHARLYSQEKPSSDGRIALKIQSSDTHSTNDGVGSIEFPSNNVITVTSDGNPNNFFHEDYFYSFLPTSSSETQWQFQRIPKHDRKRKLQSAEEGASEEGDAESGSNMAKITNGILALTCVVFAALAAGLTMGMLSLDPLTLEIKRRASSVGTERQWSADLLPLLVGHSKRHRLLCSLLLMNSFANEALPLFLDELFPSKLASIVVSVTLVLLFGEIVPTALFTGPNQVEMAAKLVPLVKAVMFVLAPVAVPIAKLLDKVLHDGSDGGHKDPDAQQDVTEGNFFNRSELTALVRIQFEAQLFEKRKRKQEKKVLLRSSEVVSRGVSSSHGSSFSGSNLHSNDQHSHNSIRSISNELTAINRPSRPTRMPSIHKDEITMIEGALAMTTKVAADIYTPIRRMYALPSDTILDEDTVVEIWARGFSRVPVYEPRASALDAEHKGSSSNLVDTSGIVGVLMVRQLIVVNPAEERPIDTLPLAMPSCISPSMHLVDLMNHFQAGGGRGRGGLHLALVCAYPNLATEALERGESIPKNAGVVGVITLEDVVEELLQEEIYDEADRDLELSQWAVKKWKRFVMRKKARLSKLQPKDGATTEATPLLE